jgi:hypothetical protein
MSELSWDDPRFERQHMDIVITHPAIYDEYGYRKGLTCFQAFSTDVSLDGEKIGSIGGGMGHVVINDHRTGKIWMIRHDELWAAYCKTVGLPEGVLEEK